MERRKIRTRSIVILAGIACYFSLKPAYPHFEAAITPMDEREEMVQEELLKLVELIA